MLRFFSLDPRSKESAPATDSIITLKSEPPVVEIPPSDPPAPKRRRRDSCDDSPSMEPTIKRPKLNEAMRQQVHEATSNIERIGEAADLIELAFQSQIQLKHKELEMINESLAKCQVALEQLRRCHLIPYPTNCPTPEQMVEISNGSGYALQAPGRPVPRHAPPFGVVEGPYARHYAQWLIPHPNFDGIQVEPLSSQDAPYSNMMEGRSTRNSRAEPSSSLVRGRQVDQKRPALSLDKPQVKARAGPCIITKANGETVRLECIKCGRDNFNSTQGFINHCRIAHRLDFKSHEEAAAACGQPYDPASEGAPPNAPSAHAHESSQVDRTAVRRPSYKVAAEVSRQTGAVNALAGGEMTHQEACASLSMRIATTLKQWNMDKPGQNLPKSLPKVKPETMTESTDTARDAPYLSRLLQKRSFSGNLRDLIADAKTKLSDQDMALDFESEDESLATPVDNQASTHARMPVVKRVPVRATDSPVATSSHKSQAHELYSKGVHPNGLNDSGPQHAEVDDDLEGPSLSPNAHMSNNAPSLVSDDGEYDDSEDASSMCGHSEAVDTESVSDVADISMDEDHGHRSLRRSSTGIASAVRLRRQEPKHVAFVSPMANTRDTKRKRNA
ncbi:uncharacterized protein F5Z01DRAFT_673767 [Emericellopsis atlantica]|uniref:AHC1-like C2H2 zinc-finger domain-containing protein n=1 Tax=Emericellopsis atlantica TaxID=2614577 RepID=A0A9P7ZMX2_9HYPO|nr:uncharacterized protein F5Z01DRAFT_673767 [Emericellopsis atlantica]KAG9254616.1 hypothetical protein F5Z01DRAFT_673767 [Emericellopsis atlantica]